MPESYNNHILCDNLLYNTKDRLDRYLDFGNNYCYICLWNHDLNQGFMDRYQFQNILATGYCWFRIVNDWRSCLSAANSHILGPAGLSSLFQCTLLLYNIPLFYNHNQFTCLRPGTTETLDGPSPEITLTRDCECSWVGLSVLLSAITFPRVYIQSECSKKNCWQFHRTQQWWTVIFLTSLVINPGYL